MPLIELITVINAPIERCFDLARSIDLHKLSTAGTQEEAIAGVTSGLIGKGQRVTWRAKHFGIRQNLTSEITQFQYPFHFRDEMIRGVFKVLNHDHHFQQIEDHTVMTDKFYFESPGGIIGAMFTKLVLTSYLKNILMKRNKFITEVAETEQWKTIICHEL